MVLAPVGSPLVELEATTEACKAAALARERYGSSLEVLRNALAAFPSIKQQLGQHEEKLDFLEGRVSELQKQIRSFAEQVSRPRILTPTGKAAPSALSRQACGGSRRDSQESSVPSTSGRTTEANSPSKKQVVSFCEDKNSEKGIAKEVFDYQVNEFDANVPEHGHWLPNTVTNRRDSFRLAGELAKRVGGRKVSFVCPSSKTRGHCVLVEPMGKVLSPDEYVSTGLVFCILDPESTDCQEPAEEWLKVLRDTRWLDAGLSVCFPDVAHTFPDDRHNLEATILAMLPIVGVEHCILIGKGAAARVAIDLVAQEHNDAAAVVAGVMLVAPGELCDSALNREITTPGFLLWARDDPVCEYHMARHWADAMTRWKAPTVKKDVKQGEHSIDKMFGADTPRGTKDEAKVIPTLFLHFVAVSLLVAGLNHFADVEEVSAYEGTLPLPERLGRLCDELPHYVAGMLDSACHAEDLKDGGLQQFMVKLIQGPDAAKRIRRAANKLKDWIRLGLKQVISASE